MEAAKATAQYDNITIFTALAELVTVCTVVENASQTLNHAHVVSIAFKPVNATRFYVVSIAFKPVNATRFYVVSIAFKPVNATRFYVVSIAFKPVNATRFFVNRPRVPLQKSDAVIFALSHSRFFRCTCKEIA